MMLSSAVEVLCEALKHNSTLGQLNLGSMQDNLMFDNETKNHQHFVRQTCTACHIGDDGAVAISEALMVNTSLTALAMHGDKKHHCRWKNHKNKPGNALSNRKRDRI